MSFWDDQFSVEGYKYGTEPNDFLRLNMHRFKGHGRILLPGDGEGRNGVWLAEQGFDVVTVDSSSVGIKKTQALARTRGVHVSSIHSDLQYWDSSPESMSFDGIAIIYLHLPTEIREQIYMKLAECLRPRGTLLIELFHPKQLGRSSGGPKDLGMLCSLEDLRRIFVTAPENGTTRKASIHFEEILGEEVETVLDEGPGHQGPAMVTRFIGERV